MSNPTPKRLAGSNARISNVHTNQILFPAILSVWTEGLAGNNRTINTATRLREVRGWTGLGRNHFTDCAITYGWPISGEIAGRRTSRTIRERGASTRSKLRFPRSAPRLWQIWG